MLVIGVIPARMASTRFPGKPLAKILGIPMVGHVYHRSKMSRALDAVYLSTCDEAIREYAEQIGAPCIMTANSHERATDRTAEAALKIEAIRGERPDIVVIIQGDEPMLIPSMIDEAVTAMHDPSVNVVNLMAPLKDRDEHRDPNEVKVVVDQAGDALYFSRQPIPTWSQNVGNLPLYKQVCIMPFRRAFLLTFRSLPPTPLEKLESVDMLRALEHGYKVRMVLTKHETYSVDTPQDLQRVESFMQRDDLVKHYS